MERSKVLNVIWVAVLMGAFVIAAFLPAGALGKPGSYVPLPESE